jgi:hypothetical protein
MWLERPNIVLILASYNLYERDRVVYNLNRNRWNQFFFANYIYAESSQCRIQVLHFVTPVTENELSSQTALLGIIVGKVGIRSRERTAAYQTRSYYPNS